MRRPEEGKKGRSKGAKKLIVLALEIAEDGVGRAYTEVIENSSAKKLGSFLRKYVSKNAALFSDKWKSYAPLKNKFSKVKQVASDEGKNFKELHIHIMNIKCWLKGIHHHYKKEDMHD